MMGYSCTPLGSCRFDWLWILVDVAVFLTDTPFVNTQSFFVHLHERFGRIVDAGVKQRFGHFGKRRAAKIISDFLPLMNPW